MSAVRPDVASVVERGREVLTRVVDPAQPRLEVVFQGEGSHNSVTFTSYWNADVIPDHAGALHGSAQGLFVMATGEFATWRALGEAGFGQEDRYVAEGTVVFADHGEGPFEDLRGRHGRFRFEQYTDGTYVQWFTLAD